MSVFKLRSLGLDIAHLNIEDDADVFKILSHLDRTVLHLNLDHNTELPTDTVVREFARSAGVDVVGGDSRSTVLNKLIDKSVESKLKDSMINPLSSDDLLRATIQVQIRDALQGMSAPMKERFEAVASKLAPGKSWTEPLTFASIMATLVDITDEKDSSTIQKVALATVPPVNKSIPSERVSDVVKILKIINNQRMRLIQDQVNDCMAECQDLTANPKADPNLSIIGR